MSGVFGFLFLTHQTSDATWSGMFIRVSVKDARQCGMFLAIKYLLPAPIFHNPRRRVVIVDTSTALRRVVAVDKSRHTEYTPVSTNSELHNMFSVEAYLGLGLVGPIAPEHATSVFATLLVLQCLLQCPQLVAIGNTMVVVVEKIGNAPYMDWLCKMLVTL
ncbi:hypothetical protein VNO78_12462 [Psophocarpus tetragonolobus]|uniref:Uncharacterized protein n=1 Tax=Psophocarpus tetragonolobus TaxID=3891 RepID=A0AAN9SVX3_PSOTE